MTVRELINGLLDCNMDAEVKLFLNEPFTDENGDCNGYLFNINKIHGKKTIVNIVELEFADWRKDQEVSE